MITLNTVRNTTKEITTGMLTLVTTLYNELSNYLKEVQLSEREGFLLEALPLM